MNLLLQAQYFPCMFIIHIVFPEITHDPFSLVVRKEYFDCPQRDSHAVHYI